MSGALRFLPAAVLVSVLVVVAAAGVVVGEILANTTRVERDDDAGFHSAYHLHTPAGRGPTRLLVLPNNTGHTDDAIETHDLAARILVSLGALAFAGMNVAVLVPAFPRPRAHGEVYTHALDRDCLTTEIPGLRRLDLQLEAMIDDAARRLSRQGREVDRKVFAVGFSASGMFVNRFAILHPDRVAAAAVGAPGGWPIAPVKTWNGAPLTYPVGIADVEDLIGREVDIDAVRKVPLFFFMGDRDENDSVPYSDSYDDREREAVNTLFGRDPGERWGGARTIHASVNATAEFRTYPGIGHAITIEQILDIRDFLNRAAQTSRPDPGKP